MEDETKRIDTEKVNEQLDEDNENLEIDEEDGMEKLESYFTIVLTVGLVIVTIIALLMLSARFRYMLDKSGAIQTCMEWMEINILPKYIVVMQFLCDLGG